MSTVMPTALILFWWTVRNLWLKHQSFLHYYVFISTSKAHTIYIQQQSALHPGKPIRQLQRLSDTRWHVGFMQWMLFVVPLMQSIMDVRDKGKATEACGIYMQIHSFKFLTTLILFW